MRWACEALCDAHAEFRFERRAGNTPARRPWVGLELDIVPADVGAPLCHGLIERLNVLQLLQGSYELLMPRWAHQNSRGRAPSFDNYVRIAAGVEQLCQFTSGRFDVDSGHA